MTSQAEGLTDLLHRWRDGDLEARDELIRIVYTELERLARQCLRREQPDHAIHTGTLVHEACLQLIQCRRLNLNDRHHFFAIAAQVMRRWLVNEARRRNSWKRGLGATMIFLDETLIISPERDEELIALDDALKQLERQFERRCRVVELRYFTGLGIEDTAKALGVSADIVKREWRMAKIWLQRELEKDGCGNGSRSAEVD